jgi:hypothetical protein
MLPLPPVMWYLLTRSCTSCGERPRRAQTGPFKIPDACGHYDIACIDWFDFLREVGWSL